MSGVLDSLVGRVHDMDPSLADALNVEIKKLQNRCKFGLVYERNLPDAVRLWTKEPKKYDKVHILPERGQVDTEENTKIWYVSDIVGDVATLLNGNEARVVSKDDIVPVVEYNDVIYPGLKVIDKVECGGKDDPYHVLINAENYHALEMLRYAYAGKVDCIYIDPPYNTGAKDWKYNNNYVGQDDQYRHSKWLAFMERRLRLARVLLKNNSVMIVTIDEKEYLRLGMLLEQMFSDARISMVSIVMNPGGSKRLNDFSRCCEYAFFIMFGNVGPISLPLGFSEWKRNVKSTTLKSLYWRPLRRTGSHNTRVHSPGCFYPIVISKELNRVVYVGNPDETQFDIDKKYDKSLYVTCFPIRSDSTDGCWQLSLDKFKEALSKGYVRVKLFNGKVNMTYISSGEQKKVENGDFLVVGHDSSGAIITKNSFDYKPVFIPNNVWVVSSHNSDSYGSRINGSLIPGHNFSFPKSLYAVEDCLRFFVADKPDALIVDFFAGSGTTAHATMLLNHLDGGHRRCISVTNNEIGPDNEKALTKQGLRPTDKEWQSKGIANYITWERIKAAITGIATNGEPVKGDYKFTEEFPMSEGFHENAVFCELTYEYFWDVCLDRKFNAIAPILWMMAGCKGSIIEKLSKGYAITDNYAVLFRYSAVGIFVEAIKKKPSVEHVFVVTDDQQRFTNVIKKLYMIHPQNIHRLYESYLKSFEIMGEGGLDS